MTILVQLTAASHSPSQLSFSDLPAELPPMLSVAATFLGYTANNPNKKEERKGQVGRLTDKSEVCLPQCRGPSVRDSMQNGYEHDTWILNQVMTKLSLTKVHVDITVQSPMVTNVSVILS